MDGLNAGYAQLLLDEYLENPEAVPSEWRHLFESGDPEVLTGHPGLARLIEALGNGNGHAVVEAVQPVAPPVPAPAMPAPAMPAPAMPAPAGPAPAAPAPAAAPDQELLGGVAAAM